MNQLQRVQMKSPIGLLTIEGTTNRIKRISLTPQKLKSPLTKPTGVVKKAVDWLDNFFKSKNKKPFPMELMDLGLKTPFQKKVLTELWKLPKGQIETYKGLARRAGSSRAARAVGTVMKNNPLPLMIPCHRVIASDGGLGGFASGVSVKKKLLVLEGC